MDHRVLIVSPVRNEAEHIERVARAMAEQTRPPAAWIVADDGSDDGTLELLRALEAEIPFMRVVSTAPAPGTEDSPDRLAQAAAPRTFNAGLATADWREFTHVGKLDGDVELPPDYFEELLARFDADPELGIACGDLVEQFEDGPRRIPIPPHHVHGALKLYTRACFEAIGGVQTRLGWDTIDETYARMRGFRTRSFRDIVAQHHRHWGSAQGTLRGRARHGECAYIVHYGLGWVLLRSLKLSLARPPVVSGAAFVYGYLRAAVRSTPRVEDRDFRRHIRRELRRRLLGPVRSRLSSPGRKFAAGRTV
jgi:glycosyltransferase involved in cell wall biosynthesis